MENKGKAAEEAAKTAAEIEGDRNYLLWVVAALLNIFSIIALAEALSSF